uniref:Reverse transcriptase Ty1/copia-type domain-containing protein n=1 Tax=Fagus sylvatica TaxID=28930 RepID=A0A2N9IS10_FAGSY
MEAASSSSSVVIVPILKSKNLMGFFTSRTLCPLEFKCDKDGNATTKINPAYVTWYQQDQMILSWINNSLSAPVLSTMARFTSSHATWSSLEKRYASQSKNRILQLRNDLLTTKGEGLSISDFVDKINHIVDSLALAGKPIDDDELVTIIMNNVGPAYEVTVSSSQARDTPISYDDVVALLLTAEMRLKAQNTPSLETNPTAMYAPKPTHHSTRGRGSLSHRGSPMRGRGSSSARRSWTYPTSSAIDCFQRMNHAYEGRIPTQKLTTMAAIASSNAHPTTWISDTGASNHITSDLANLAIHNEYHGQDQVAMGNGVGRPFASVGVRVGAPVWHSRLGHPASNTLSHLFSNKCLPLSATTSTPPTTSTSSNIPPTTTSSLPATSIPTLAPPIETLTHTMVTRRKAGICKPNPKYDMHVAYDPQLIEPTCYSQAVKHAKWRQAMADEFNALQRNGTWSLVPPRSDMNILPNKWVFKIKKCSDGSVKRYKARLVANGFHQQEGLDYTETFSLVVKHSIIRTVLALAVHHKWPIQQLDVQNAFLHGVLSEEVYMRQTSGFNDSNYPNYGDMFIILLIYVDDILITGNNSFHISELIHNLSKLFSMKDLGPLHFFLGIEAVYKDDSLYLTQTKYTMDLLFRTKFQDAKALSSPAPSGKKLSLFDGDPLQDPTEYRSVVGALQYLTITRPDISFAVNQVCQFMHQPTTSHWTAVKCILRYLKHTPDHGLYYQPGPLHLEAYSDADYAGNPDDRHSTGGYCIYLGPNLVSWSAKKHRMVSRSSTEAEYRQLAYTATEISWFRSLFKDLGISLNIPLIWCDNISSISLASNPVFHARTKHLEVDYHYVLDKVIRNELAVNYICTLDQVADIFTKGLSFTRFKFLTSKLMVRCHPIRLWGCDSQTSSPDIKQSAP